MLIARAPVRISLAGGGTDMPSYYREHGGLVVSTTIDKYFYVIVNLNGADSVQITSSDYSMLYRHQRGTPLLFDGDLSLPRAFLHQFGIEGGLSLFLASEIPPGTGLGSSSTVSVALGKALSTIGGLSLTDHQLAELASYVEIEKLGMPIGKQDQYAAAFGGLNAIRFTNSQISVEPLFLDPEVQRTLDHRMMLFFTGSSRSSASILQKQDAATQHKQSDVIESLHQIKAMAERAVRLLQDGQLDEFGELLHQSWQAKKRLAAGISNPQIDDAYMTALEAGAIGGKIAGAGGGGFLMLYCPDEHQAQVTTALEARGLARMDFHFEESGAVVLMDALPRVRKFGATEPALLGMASQILKGPLAAARPDFALR